MNYPEAITEATRILHDIQKEMLDENETSWAKGLAGVVAILQSLAQPVEQKLEPVSREEIERHYNIKAQMEYVGGREKMTLEMDDWSLICSMLCRFILAQPATAVKVCKWEMDGWGCYHTSCDAYLPFVPAFADDESKVKYCPACGGEIQEVKE